MPIAACPPRHARGRLFWAQSRPTRPNTASVIPVASIARPSYREIRPRAACSPAHTRVARAVPSARAAPRPSASQLNCVMYIARHRHGALMRAARLPTFPPAYPEPRSVLDPRTCRKAYIPSVTKRLYTCKGHPVLLQRPSGAPAGPQASSAVAAVLAHPSRREKQREALRSR